MPTLYQLLEEIRGHQVMQGLLEFQVHPGQKEMLALVACQVKQVQSA